LNTSKNCPLEENLPKIQQYKNYFFHKISKEDKEKYANYFLPSDHLAIRYPDKNFLENKSYPFLEMKAQYNAQSCTNNSWQPKNNQKSVNNISSVAYDIITNGKNEHYFKPKGDMKKINFKKLGFGHIADMNHPFYPNFNKDYRKAFEENKNIFKCYNGIFSKMYEDSSRNGNIYLPFEPKNMK